MHSIVADALLRSLWWILLFPLVYVAATPIILLISLIGEPRQFVKRVVNNYRRVIIFWAKWGIVFVP